MTPRAICYFLLVVGLGLFLYSFTLSYYSDQASKDKLDEGATQDLRGEQYERFKEYYYTEVDKLKTNKTAFLDFGSGLAIASLTILFFLFLQKIYRFSDFMKVVSVSKIKLIAAANLIWLLLIPGTYWYYIFRVGRGDYPWFADSIGIPLMYQIPQTLLGLIPLNVFLFLSYINSNHPTILFTKATHYNTKEVFKEMFWGFWFLLNIIFLVLFVIDGDHVSIPVNLFFTFVLLNLRAGQIAEPKLNPIVEYAEYR
jgi:hypothetical protein